MVYQSRQEFPVRAGEKNELLSLFFPVAVTILSGSLLALVERLLLARYSIEGMEAALTVMYISRLFYFPCMAVPLMAQAAIGFHIGAQEKRAVGPCTWQMVWFCIFSAFITIPLGWSVGQSYFSGTSIAPLALPYYHLMIPLNFLYPLITAFAAFYIGIGRARFFLVATIATHLFHLGLCYLLIFGLPGWIHPMGIIGAGIATLITQGGLCLFLAISFLHPAYREVFGTDKWQFNRLLLWRYSSPGLFRFGARVLCASSWAALTWVVSRKGDDFLLVFSVGGTIAIFTTFVGEALSQVMTTMASRVLGAKLYHKLPLLYRSSLSLFVFSSLLLAIPTILFPETTMAILFSPEKCIRMREMLVPILLGNWIFFLVFTFNSIPMGFILAHQYTKFSLFISALNWVETLTIYAIIQVFEGPAVYFWAFVALAMFFWETLLLYRKMRSLNDSVLVNVEPSAIS